MTFQGEDSIDETVSWLYETEETDNSEGTSDCSDLHETRPLTSWPATFHSPVPHCEEVSCGAIISCQCSKDCHSHLGIDESCMDEPADLWKADKDCIFDNDVEDVENLEHSLSRKLKPNKNVAGDCDDEVLPASDLQHPESNCRSKVFSNHSSSSAFVVGENITSSCGCQCVGRSELSSPANGSKLEKANGVEFPSVKPIARHISSPDNCVVHNCSQNVCNMSGEMSAMGSFSNNIETGNSGKSYATCENCDQTLLNETLSEAGVPSHQCLSVNDPNRYCCAVVHPESSCHSLGASQNMQAEDDCQSVTAQLQQLCVNPVTGLPVQHSDSVDQYESFQISEESNSSPEANTGDGIHTSRIDSENANFFAYKAANQTYFNNVNYNNTKSEELKCKHSVGNEDLNVLSVKEYYRKQTIKNKDGVLGRLKTHFNTAISSYEQHGNSNTDETLVEDDVPCSCVNSDVYYGQDEDSSPLHYETVATAEQVDMSSISQHSPYDNSQISNRGTCSTSHKVATQEFDISSEDQEVASTCSSVASSHSDEHHEAILCADDQTFKCVATRQPVMVTYMPTGCSIPYMSDMNCSMYGTAVAQALGRPAVMSRPAIHFAQHPGSAAMMQQSSAAMMQQSSAAMMQQSNAAMMQQSSAAMMQQSRSPGFSGGMAQANVMTHSALPNGMQATAVLQHHSLTNGGQTMMVQQRTMITGLGGLAQQTVIQQRVAAPATMTQSTMMHVRQRALTSQQASLIQQRGIRFVPAGVVGTPLLQSHSIQSTAVIEGRATALMGHGLVSGVNQSHVMQHLVRQRYLGGPIMPGRSVQLVAGHPARLVNK